jgi:DNA polymerase-3 subunit alpha
MGGIVTEAREATTRKGGPYGVIKMEDFTGSAEIALFGNEYIEYSKYFRAGMYLLIRGKIEPRRWKEEELDFRISSMSLLQEEKSKLIEKISISVPIHSLDEPVINELSVLIKTNPGNSLLYFRVIDGEYNVALNLFSQNIRLNVTRELIDFLTGNDDIDFKIN